MNTRLTLATLITMICWLAPPPAVAQDADEIRAKELQAKIRKEMAEIDELLLQTGGGSAKDAADAKTKIEKVKKDIDELLKDVQGKQAAVVADIEELVRLRKACQSKSGQKPPPDSPESENQNQKPSERDKDPEVDELKKQSPQGQKPEDQQKSENQDKPTSGQPDQDRGKNEPADHEKPPGETDKFEREDVNGRWGVLPPKVAEMFQTLDPERYPERYRRLIEQYYRRAAQQKAKGP